jgi:hypothetical protein
LASLGTLIAQRGWDPSWLASTSHLTPEQFGSGLQLALRLAEFDIRMGISFEAARRLGPEQLRLSGELAYRLATEGCDPTVALTKACPFAAKYSSGIDQFRENLNRIAVLERLYRDQGLRRLGEFHVIEDYDVEGLTSFHVAQALDLAARLAGKGVRFSGLGSSLSTIAKASPSDDEFVAYLQQLELLETRLTECNTWNGYTCRALAIAAKSLPKERLLATVQLACRLASGWFYDKDILELVGPAISQASPDDETYRSNLEAAADSLERVRDRPGRGIGIHSLAEGLRTAATTLKPREFHAGLRLLPRLVEHGVDGSELPGIPALMMQATALQEQYSGFKVVHHPPVTHTDEYSGFDYTDHTAWVELRPVGVPIKPLLLSAITGDQLIELLKHRSWLWRFHTDEAQKQQALERIAHLLPLLDGILRRLWLVGVLESGVKLTAVYLIGSYPWVANPHDIDLFLITDDDRELVHLSSNVLAEHGFAAPELQAPLSVEIVGLQKLQNAARATGKTASRLALRRALIFGCRCLPVTICFGLPR